MLLEGKRGLIVGVANKRSIAWGIAQAVSREGARLAITFQNERLEKNVRKLAGELTDPVILPCDVSDDSNLDALAEQIRDQMGGLDFGDNTQASTEQNPVHLYTLPGDYIAILTVRSGGASATAQVPIKVGGTVMSPSGSR